MAGAEFYSPETVATEPKNEGRTDELMGILEKTRRDDGYIPDRERQKQVLNNLPENIIEQLRAHLYAAHLEQEFFAKLRGKDGQNFSDSRVLRGEVFENLVENDPKFGNKSQADEEFLALMHDPARFNFQNLKHHRNPDSAGLESSNKGRISIKFIVESKLGLINSRGRDQVFDGGLREGVEEDVVMLNANKDSLRDHGLTSLAQERDQVPGRLAEKHGVKVEKFQKADFIEVDEDFYQILVVPANRQIEDPKTLFAPELLREIKEDERDEYVARLIRQSRTQLERAAFSTQEVSALANYFLENIYEREKNNPNFRKEPT